MQIQTASKNVFAQLEESLHLLSNSEYEQPGKLLFNATIGRHVRHILELFICLENGYETGLVNYEERKRDTQIEKNKDFARHLLWDIYKGLNKNNKELLLEAGYDEASGKTVEVTTNYYREIIYNLEHTVHHMALIRIGVNEVSCIQLPKDYGVAASTIKHRKATA